MSRGRGILSGLGGLAPWRRAPAGGVATSGEQDQAMAQFLRQNLGRLALLLLLAQGLGGFLLLLHYRPSPGEALASLWALDSQVWGGWLLRRLHAAGGQLLLLLALARWLWALRSGAYAQGRRGVWLGGCLFLGAVFVQNTSGAILPWSLAAQGALASLLGLGGQATAPSGLALAFALHMALPLPLWLFCRARRDRLGEPRQPEPFSPFVPPPEPQPTDHLGRVLLAGGALALLWGLALLMPDLLLLPDLAASAAGGGPTPLPWHLLAPAALAARLPPGLGLGLISLAGLGLTLLPWWDRRGGDLWRRPAAARLALGVALLWLVLSLWGWLESRPW